FVIIEDFIRYATVIKRQNGKLRRLWLKVWEPRRNKAENGTLAGTLGPDKTVVVRIGPEPVQDIDGDGRKEILASVFNLERDQQWHVLGLHPLTGATKLDLPGQFLQGVRDADGDGMPDLFCAAAPHGPRLPEPTSLAISSVRGRTPRRIWEQNDAS